MLLLLLVLLGVCALGIAASVLLWWASGKSPLWNIGFAVLIVLFSAAVLLLGIVVMMRRISL
jgi:hypothetical protein